MADPFVGEIRIFGFNFMPTGWAACDGALIPIRSNTALFSILGTTYGGDGQTTFALPDLQGCFPMGTGQGPGLSFRSLGERVGQAQVALTAAHLPAHTHPLLATSSATSASPAGAAFANVATNGNVYRRPGVLAPSGSALGPAGSSLPHENRQPALALMFCIALQGVFPPRG